MDLHRIIVGFALSICLIALCGERPPELWKEYMHGIVPEKANRISIADIGKSNPQLAKFISADNGHGGEPGVKIMRDSDLTVSIPLELQLVRNGRIRLFYWCKAIKVGYGNGWHAPWLVLIAKDGEGKLLVRHEAWFHTEGTYPWHCYYVELFLPKNTENFAIRFYTPNGIAYFSDFVWETITDENTYDNNYKQDPNSGSLVLNVLYDQMPEHMTHG